MSPPGSPSRAVRSFRRGPIYPACTCELPEAPCLAPWLSRLDRTASRDARLSGGGCPGGGGRGQRPPLGVVGGPWSEGGGAAAAHWLPTRLPSTGAAAEMNIVLKKTEEWAAY